MSVPHSSTPWSLYGSSQTIFCDAEGRVIGSVSGSNEQAQATAAHIVRCVNADAEAQKALPDGE